MVKVFNNIVPVFQLLSVSATTPLESYKKYPKALIKLSIAVLAVQVLSVVILYKLNNTYLYGTLS
jgi:hypothetical protein